MKTLAKRWYKMMEDGKEVKCPHKDCDGLLVKINVSIFEQYTEEYWENTNYYKCEECKDFWKYCVSALVSQEN